nr:CocE/NonD family hydrolase [Burkholderia multivorans]
MRDGVKIFAKVYLPQGNGRFPTLLAASAYRSDNVNAPESSLFLWRETGPIQFYLDHGYAYVHMDVRGTGRSGGEYRYHDSRENHDLYDVVEWLAKQPWSNGKIGGIGESYYAQEQWFMAEENPPHLSCIAPYDGNPDTYHFSAYQGGIPSAYPSLWFNDVVRPNNAWPLEGNKREITWDYAEQMLSHPLYDDFWKTRSALDGLGKIRVPVYSIGL